MGAHFDSKGDDGASEGIRYQHILSALLRRWLLIVSLFAVGVGATATILTFIPNKYKASAFVRIEPQEKKIVQIDTVVPTLKGDTATIESEVEVLRSLPIAEGVIEKLGLRQDPEFKGAAKKTSFGDLIRDLTAPAVRAMPSMGAAPSAEPTAIAGRGEGGAGKAGDQAVEPMRDRTVAEFLGRLKVQRVRNTFVLEITFTSGDAVKAARIANAIAEVYIQSQLDEKRGATEAASALLARRVDQLRSSLTEAEERLEAFKIANNLFASEGHLLTDEQLAREMEEIVRARDATAQARARTILSTGSCARDAASTASATS